MSLFTARVTLFLIGIILGSATSLYLSSTIKRPPTAPLTEITATTKFKQSTNTGRHSFDDIRNTILSVSQQKATFQRNATLYHLISQIALKDFSDLWNTVLQHDPSSDKTTLLAILERWVELSPQEAFAQAVSLRIADHRQAATALVLEKWIQTNRAETIATIKQLPPLQKSEAFNILIKQYAKTDPEKIDELILSFGVLPREHNWIKSLYSEWAQSSPQEAFKHALSERSFVKDSDYFDIYSELKQWLDRSPKEAMDFMHSRGETGKGTEAKLFQYWLRKSPDEAINYIADKTLNSPTYRPVIGTIAAQIARSNPQNGLQWIEQKLTPELRETAYQSFFHQLSTQSPQEASKLIQQLPPGTTRSRAMSSLAAVWADQDVYASFEWLNTLPPGEEQLQAYQKVMHKYIERSPSEASQLIETMNPGAQKSDFIERLANRYAEQNPKAAIEWALSLKEPANQEQALKKTIQHSTIDDIGALMDTLINRSPEKASDELLTTLVHQLVNDSQPEESTVLLEHIEDPATKQMLTEQMLASWLQENELEAMQWAAHIASSDLYVGNASAIVDYLSNSNPQTAFQWAARVEDSGKRKKLFTKTLPEWFETSPSTARNAIQSSGLSAQEKKKLLNQFDEPDMVLPIFQ